MAEAVDEAAFLEAIKSDAPNAAEDARLVYADWLEERGDPRAEYLRLELELYKLGPAARHPARFEQRRRRDELAAVIDPDWLAAVAHPVNDEGRRVRVAAVSSTSTRPSLQPNAPPALPTSDWRARLDARTTPLPSQGTPTICSRCDAPTTTGSSCPRCGHQSMTRTSWFYVAFIVFALITVGIYEIRKHGWIWFLEHHVEPPRTTP